MTGGRAVSIVPAGGAADVKKPADSVIAFFIEGKAAAVRRCFSLPALAGAR